MARWRIDVFGKFKCYVDADHTRNRRFDPGGLEFVNATNNVVFTIESRMLGSCGVTAIPTARLSGGSRDGELVMLDSDAPREIRMVPLVKLSAADFPPGPSAVVEMPEPEVWLHSARCVCHGSWRGPVEHLYVHPGGG